MNSGISDPAGIDENQRHNELLAWATSQIDQLTESGAGGAHLCDMLDWMAYFTREHFGFQQRLLADCGRQREYVFDRIEAYGNFRRQLAQLCLDSMRGDTTVPQRLSLLCHELLQDEQANRQRFIDALRDGGPSVKLRRKPRHGQLATEAANDLLNSGQRADSPKTASSGSR